MDGGGRGGVGSFCRYLLLWWGLHVLTHYTPIRMSGNISFCGISDSAEISLEWSRRTRTCHVGYLRNIVRVIQTYEYVWRVKISWESEWLAFKKSSILLTRVWLGFWLGFVNRESPVDFIPVCILFPPARSDDCICTIYVFTFENFKSFSESSTASLFTAIKSIGNWWLTKVSQNVSQTRVTRIEDFLKLSHSLSQDIFTRHTYEYVWTTLTKFRTNPTWHKKIYFPTYVSGCSE